MSFHNDCISKDNIYFLKNNSIFGKIGPNNGTCIFKFDFKKFMGSAG
jgi:hypothetical protein